jgi:hypothetical protein
MPSIREIVEAKELGVNWLLSQLNVDCSMSPYDKAISSFYRVPWAFAVTGHTWEGTMMLEWYRRNMFTPEGDFAGEYSRKDADSYYAYPNANLIHGAHLLRQYDISRRGMRFLLTLQDRDSGGFFNRKDNLGPSGEQDIWNTSQAGLTCLLTGYYDEAKRVGAFLERMWELQPDAENRLYTVYSPSRGLVTDFPEEKASIYHVDVDKPKQLYFKPGIAAAFLSRLYLCSAEQRFRDLATRYIEFAMSCSEDQFSRPQVRKTGWGAGLVYQITGDTKYRAHATKVLDYILDAQYPEGHWVNLIAYSAAPEREKAIETTAEAIVHLDHITASINVY